MTTETVTPSYVDLPKIFTDPAQQMVDRLIAVSRHAVLNGAAGGLEHEDRVAGEEARNFIWHDLIVFAVAYPFEEGERPKFKWFRLLRLIPRGKKRDPDVKLICGFDADMLTVEMHNKKVAREVMADLARLSMADIARADSLKKQALEGAE